MADVIEFHEAKRKVSRFGSGHRIHCALLKSYWHAGRVHFCSP